MDTRLSFATFADRKYRGSLRRIAAEARQFDCFTRSFAYSDRDLCPSFWGVHRDFMLRSGRLFGYCIWKPQVVAQTLAALDIGDVLLYCDAGCSLNPEGMPRLREYVDLVTSHPSGMLAFHGEEREGTWTKMDLLEHLESSDRTHRDSAQIWAGMFLLVKSETTMRFVDQWASVMSEYRLIDDSPSRSPNDDLFRENRHDQSVFSILFKKAGGLALPDETFWPGEWDRKRELPIHARRWRHFTRGSAVEMETRNRYRLVIETLIANEIFAMPLFRSMAYPKNQRRDGDSSPQPCLVCRECRSSQSAPGVHSLNSGTTRA